MTTDYKPVFQLAQDKGYKFYISFEWANQLAADNRETELLVELALIQKWLRDEHKLHVWVSPDYNGYPTDVKELTYGWQIEDFAERTNGQGGFDSYEQALLVAIEEALKLIP